jgi:hypothetical protein
MSDSGEGKAKGAAQPVDQSVLPSKIRKSKIVIGSSPILSDIETGQGHLEITKGETWTRQPKENLIKEI